MNALSVPRFVAIAIMVYATFQSRDLPLAWRDAPYERLSPILALVWGIPFLLFLFRKRLTDANTGWILASFALTFSHSILQINALAYAGLACALIAFLPEEVTPLRRLVSFFTALCWMPITGWALSTLSPLVSASLRLAVILLLQTLLFLPLLKKNQARMISNTLQEEENSRW